MKYFSLLFQTEQQESLSQKRKDTNLLNYNKVSLKKKYKMVGNKMVIDQDAPTTQEFVVPHLYEDLNLSVIKQLLYPEDNSSKYESKLLQLATDIDTVLYRQQLLQTLEDTNAKNILKDFYLHITSISHYIKMQREATSTLRRGKHRIDAYCLLFSTLENIIEKLGIYNDCNCLSLLQTWLQEFLSNLDNVAYQEAFSISNELKNISWKMTISNKKIYIIDSNESTSYLDSLKKILEISDDIDFHISLGPDQEINALDSWVLKYISIKYPDLAKRIILFSTNQFNLDVGPLDKVAEEIDFYLRGILMLQRWKDKGFHTVYGKIGNNIEFSEICEYGMVNSCDNLNEITFNSISINESKRGAFITGVNQGGKTTFLRSIGQAIYLTLLGFPCIGSKVVIPWISGIYTHFTAEETVNISNGKLVEELNHIKIISDASGEDSFLLLNELFSSTTLYDARELNDLFINSCLQKGQYVFCVTHIPEITEDISELESYRTSEYINYKIVPGKATANTIGYEIAKRHHLLTEDIRRRING